MGGNYGRRRVCYVQTNKTELNELKFVKRIAFAAGFMVCVEASYNGKVYLIFIKKIGKSHEDEVLKPSLKKVFRDVFLEERMTWNFIKTQPLVIRL